MRRVRPGMALLLNFTIDRQSLWLNKRYDAAHNSYGGLQPPQYSRSTGRALSNALELAV